jgi:CRISPR-associated endoribonuclease Cas6
MNRGASVPFHHQLVLSEFIKGIKREMSPEFQDNDVYAFSGLKGQTKVGRNGLHFFSAKVTLVLSSPNEDFLNELLRKIFAKKRVFLSKLELVPETVEKEITPDFQEQMKYICISPLVPTAEELDENYVREYIDPLDDKFSDLLFESTISRMELFGGFSAEELASFTKFQVIPDKSYLTRLREMAKKYSRMYATYDRGVDMDLRGYTMPFTLYADPKVQQFVFNCGFGEYTNLGFGMVDIANVNPIGRCEIYEGFKK